ncbi:hypothetical protein GCM10007858_28160 [Bradyrhizobium liaoningense]|nr:hypothetical protein GCM10007858_28160 [Bradyrhizobium liaoningense]
MRDFVQPKTSGATGHSVYSPGLYAKTDRMDRTDRTDRQTVRLPIVRLDVAVLAASDDGRSKKASACCEST